MIANIISIWFAKALGWLLRLGGRQGAALPGLIIEKLHPNFLPSMLAKLPDGVIIVSGTNGKTTTTKMIAELLRAESKWVLTNKTGGNFVRGVISTIAQAATASGGLPYDVAVFEQDEAYAVHFVEKVRPKAVVLLNVTRDQLDRFGEIDTTAALLQKVVNRTTDSVILNDDDTRLNRIEVPDSVKAVYFGIDSKLLGEFPNDEQLYGAISTKLAEHPRVVELENVQENHAKYTIGGQAYDVELKIDGQHNALNGAAALSAVLSLYPEAKAQQLVKLLGNIRPAFGRGEAINYDGRRLILQLVKNPASFRQALHVLDIHQPKSVGIVINDEYADGRDVSWLWDIDFKLLKGLPVVAGGRRGYDMANRLKYDEVKTKSVEHKLKSLIEKLITQAGSNQTVIIFATYTAMLEVRKTIGRLTEVEKV